MKALILAGGLGTRLRPLTNTIPKPLLPVGRKPILEIIIQSLKGSGFTDIILAVGYKAELIKGYFHDGRSFGVNIAYVEERERMGTAGPIKLAEHLLDEPFITMNGDILTKLDFRKMYETHIASYAELTVGTVDYKIRLPYGIIEIQEDRKIMNVKEKPELSFYINAAIYVVSPSMLDVIPKETLFDMTDAIKKLAEQGRNIRIYPITEYWRDIGIMEDYEKANAEIAEWT